MESDSATLEATSSLSSSSLDNSTRIVPPPVKIQQTVYSPATGQDPSPSAYSPQSYLDLLVNSQLIYDAGLDTEGRPILVFYSCKLPDPKRVDYDVLLDKILHRFEPFVDHDYIVILFSAGSTYQPSWSWLFQAYRKLNRKYRKNVKNLFIVHPTTWFKLLLQWMGSIVSPKFARKVVWVKNLSHLKQLVQIENLHIPEAIFEINVKYEDVKKPIHKEPWSLSGWLTGSTTSTTSHSVVKESVQDLHSTRDTKGAVFGNDLDTMDLCKTECGKGPVKVEIPHVLVDCKQVIMTSGLHLEGIFRHSASSKALADMKIKYNQAHNPHNKTRNAIGTDSIHLEEYGDAHLAACLIKGFFRDLNTPIFPSSLYPALNALAENVTMEPDRIEYIKQSILPLLSHPTVSVLHFTFDLLHAISINSNSNKMTPKNLCIVFAPNLVSSPDALTDFKMCDSEGGGVGLLCKLCIMYPSQIFE